MMQNSYAVGKGCEQVYKRVAEQAARGKFVLTVGMLFDACVCVCVCVCVRACVCTCMHVCVCVHV